MNPMWTISIACGPHMNPAIFDWKRWIQEAVPAEAPGFTKRKLQIQFAEQIGNKQGQEKMIRF